MGHPAVMLGQDLDLVVLDPHRVREPHILPHPLHVLHIPDRTLPELLETELDFVFGLGEMGMEMHTVMARQLGGLLHDVRRDGKGRTWRKNDLYHRTGARVMIEFDDALGVPEDGLGAVHRAKDIVTPRIQLERKSFRHHRIVVHDENLLTWRIGIFWQIRMIRQHHRHELGEMDFVPQHGPR